MSLSVYSVLADKCRNHRSRANRESGMLAEYKAVVKQGGGSDLIASA